MIKPSVDNDNSMVVAVPGIGAAAIGMSEEEKRRLKEEVEKVVRTNQMRQANIHKTFNPITGEGSILERTKVVIDDFPLREQWLPNDMLDVPLVRQIVDAGSIEQYFNELADEVYEDEGIELEYTESERQKIIEQFVRVRIKYDFAFWAAMYVYIKQKGGGEDILFWLNRPQRKLISCFERMRMAGKPIRVILLKARQWGGSTATQIYMAWLQLVHKVGLNSLIVGHVKNTSVEVKDMFAKLLNDYPTKLLYELGETYDEKQPKIVGVGHSGDIQRVPRRNFKIKIGTAENPDSARGGDYNLLHCTEVGLWKTTEGKTPRKIVQSACSGILLKPYTMIVYESTANGTGNFFQTEYDAAKRGLSQFEALFIAWYEIDQYSAPIDDVYQFASWLWQNRNNTDVRSNREESGQYLWWLWEQGATLEAINWYIMERSGKDDHGVMASEYPSDDVEAFVHSGSMVFDKYKVEKFRKSCMSPKWIGDVYADGDEGDNAMMNVRFAEDHQGKLHVWAKPDVDDKEMITDRYLVVVDIGGRSKKADYSVILVLDRLNQMDGGVPVVVAQWWGHIDMDILAWKAAQIASWYDDALLVIESNTLETHDKERQVDGDMSGYILNQIKDVYPNLYARKQSDEEIKNQEPKRYGFHTNVATKPKIISTLVKVIRDRLYVERDENCLSEYLCYERKKNGAFGAIVGKHDDLLMTRAIGLHISYYEMEIPTIVKRRSERPKKNRKTVGVSSF